MNNILQCQNLSKIFIDGEQQLKVLDNVNLTLAKGAQCAIMGSSGSGKTTLLQLMGGLDKPSSGSVQVNGCDINLIAENSRCNLRNATIGFVYQFHHLLAEFSALENIILPMLIAGKSKAHAINLGHELLSQAGLEARAQHKPNQLSGGECQRLAILRAMANQPSIILADEPTGNLDSFNAYKVIQLLQQLNQKFNTALIIVTHAPEIAQLMSLQFNMEDGKLQQA